MARYDFRCPDGHVTEVACSMADVPPTVECLVCSLAQKEVTAERIFTVPAAIHFKGPGFYATDVKGALHRKRRSNAGDDLPKEFDSGAARIADAV
jgi:predicted nucleic acid-binding Zn ribbon protein